MNKRNAIFTILVTLLLVASVFLVRISHSDRTAQVDPLNNAQIDLIRAITTAEQAGQGKAISAFIQDKGDKTLYEVELLKKDIVTKVVINSMTGQIIAARAGAFDKSLSDIYRVELSALSHNNLNLAKAAGLAEEYVKGRAIDARIEDKGGKILYRVKVIKDNKINTVTIDSKSHQIVSPFPAPDH